LSRIFAERKQTGGMDLEAVEMGFRAALHQAGAAAVTQLLQFPEPAPEQCCIPCPCGHQARYRELRSRRILTALGAVELTRPWYLCPHCHNGQFPVDRQLDVENRDCSPGVRRMQAIVGQAAPFDHGREQMKVLAGLEVTAKSVERAAEAIGADIAAGEQCEIRKAVQLDLPVIMGKPMPILYVQMDGTGVPVVKKETEGRNGKTDGQPAHTREAKLGCVFTQTTWDQKATRFVIRIRPPIPGPSRRPKSLASVSIWRPGTVAGATPQRKSSWVTEPSGSGTRRICIFPAPCRSSTFITRASIFGTWRAGCTPTTP
jgi:hypothetical protein